MRRVAALYDVHGMLEALDAVLAEVERKDVDLVLVGGDVAGGPQPAEALERLRALGDGAAWIRGNGDRALAAGDPSASTGSAELLRWTNARLSDEQRSFLGALPAECRLRIDGLGDVLFCHATPHSDVELVTAATPEPVLERVLVGVDADVVVAGHTHMQVDRRVNGVRWVNPGSVGMPFEGELAAFWALLGPDVELLRTAFDVERAAHAIRETGWPPFEWFVRETARPREEATALFERIAAERGER